VAHAPPEVLSGHEPDARSDVYSLASTIYELIAGRPAFVQPTDTSPVPVLMRITSEPVPDLDSGLAPAAVSHCLQQAMAKDRDHRPATAAAFGALLQAAAAGAGNWPNNAATQVAPLYVAPPTTPPSTSPPRTGGSPTVPPATPTQVRPGGAPPPAATGGPSGVSYPGYPSPGGHAAGPPPSTHPAPQGFVSGPRSGPDQASYEQHRGQPATWGSAGRGPIWLALGGVAAAMILIVGAIVLLAGNDDPQVAEGDPIEAGANDDPTGTATDAESAQAADPDTLAGGTDQTEPPTVETTPATVAATTPPAAAIDTISTAGRIDALERLVAGNLVDDPGYASLPDYGGYETYTDGAGVIVVSIPTDWDDRLDVTSQGTPGIQVGTSIAGAFAGQAESGVSVFLYPPGSLPYTDVDPLLELLIEVNELNCIERPSVEFDHRLFSGRYQVLSDCVDTDPELLGLQMIGQLKENSDYFLQITVVASSANDVAAADAVFETLEEVLLTRVG